MVLSRASAARILGVAGLAASAALTFASPASAHGIGDDAAHRSTPDFVPVGAEHMLLGWDHLLFIVSVVLLAGELQRAAKFISLFVLAHSTTLILATLADWRVSPTAVDVVIALSIAYVGAVGLRGRPTNWRAFGIGVLGFGLIHGLGLSTRFQDIGVEDNELGKLIAFNVGIELGQLFVVAAVVLFGKLALTFLPDPSAASRPDVLRNAHFGLVTVGIIAAMVLLATRGEDVDPYEQLAADSPAACEIRTEQAPLVLQGGHPARSFFAPGETYSAADFGHVVGDGYIAVRYPSSLPPGDQDALRRLIVEIPGVVAGPVDTPGVEATTQDRVLTCEAFDITALQRFADTWLREAG